MIRHMGILKIYVPVIILFRIKFHFITQNQYFNEYDISSVIYYDKMHIMNTIETALFVAVFAFYISHCHSCRANQTVAQDSFLGSNTANAAASFKKSM